MILRPRRRPLAAPAPLLVCLAALALRATAAEAPSVDERFRALEARLATVEQENAALRRELVLRQHHSLYHLHLCVSSDSDHRLFPTT